ncbi:MAG: cytochrome P450 [Acidimicrobiia bacterium]
MSAPIEGSTFVDPLDLVDAARYARDGYPHDAWTRLRAEAPIARFEPEGFKPFWAITKHADIVEISRQPVRFSSERGLTLARAGAPDAKMPEMVVMLDPPRHVPMRRTVSARFSPKAVRAHQAEVERITREILDAAATGGDVVEGDFVERVAGPLPLAVMAWMVGLPRSDWDLLFNLTNEVIGNNDPEYRRPGESAGRTIQRARREIHSYFEALIEERRRDPGDDLVSELIRARIDGEPLTQDQLLAYCELLVEAGNETTRNAISGGLLALCENPEEWEKLRKDRELLRDAVEEVLRWVTPISHFTRVATEDCRVRGVDIARGDQVALYYASANRDEDVFDDPFAFRVDRNPNQHLAFGFGEHVCMGAHLARVELEAVFGQLLDRLEFFELAGPVERLESAVNGSIKHLPLRYRLA